MSNEPENRIPLEDLRVFHQLARSLTSSFDLDAILRAIVENMERFVQAEIWTLLLLDPERQDLYYAYAAGGAQEQLRDLRVKIGEGVAGWVVEHQSPVVIPDTASDPSIAPALGDQPQKIHSVIALPLCGRKGAHGAIEIVNPGADQFTDYTITFLHLLADFAAIAIENAQDVARIQQLTITDDTTGLFNVRFLYQALEQELARCLPLGLPISLAFIDLDRFKLVNDSYGHLVGSQLLARTGERIRELSRPQDLCFRYGGDEFVILMPETDQATASALCTELRQKLMTTVFPLKNKLNLCVDPSIGLATAPEDGKLIQPLIAAADSRMYAEKNRPR